MKFLCSVALPIYIVDQLTKWATIQGEASGALPRVVIEGFFELVYWKNTGAAFSMGTGRNTFFIAISIVALIGLLIAWRKNVFPDTPSRWGVALLLGGILGNLTDRLLHGHVVDMLLFDLHVPMANPWPAFNVADSAICIAVGFFFYGSLRAGAEAKLKATTPAK